MKRIGELAARYHHWLGVICCIAVLSWGASGILHPIMSRLSPQPARMQPPAQVISLHNAQPPAAVLARAGIDVIASLRVLKWDAKTCYQVTLPQQTVRRYFDVRSGDELANGDQRYAAYLAQHFSARQATTTPIPQSRFNADYLSVNRLLPVWRVDVAGADGLRAYVETSPPRLAALVDDNKATLGTAFRWLHTWSFFPSDNAFRVMLIATMLVVVLFSALSGIWLYAIKWRRGSLRKQHPPLRRWHRGLGIAIALSALAFTVSAAWHLLHGYWHGGREYPDALQTRFAVGQLQLPDALRHGAWSSLTLVDVDTLPAYLAVPAESQRHNAAAGSNEHDHHPAKAEHSAVLPHQALYLAASDGSALPEGERRHAVQLAHQYSGLAETQVIAVSLVARFEGEYGFLNKRLPVLRVDYATPDHVSYYVEAGSGALATVVRDADRREGWSFAYLHKFHWLDFAGKDARDIVSALFALGNLAVSALGLWLFARRYLKRTKAA